MDEKDLNEAINQIEAFALKYTKIWEQMSGVRGAQDKACFMVSAEEITKDFHELLEVKKEFDGDDSVAIALGLAADALFKYSGQACLATGKKDGLTAIGIVDDDVAELGRLHLAAEKVQENK